MRARLIEHSIFQIRSRALCAGMQFSSLAVCFAANTKNALAAIIRASCGKETAKRIFFVFKRIKLHDGINVLRTKENAAERKSAIKLTISCVCVKNVLSLHSKVANFRSHEHGRAQSDKAIKRGRSFL